MSLLEILARDWPQWLGGNRVYQDADGDLIACENYGSKWVAGRAELASDRATAIVTPARQEASSKSLDRILTWAGGMAKKLAPDDLFAVNYCLYAQF